MVFPDADFTGIDSQRRPAYRDVSLLLGVAVLAVLLIAINPTGYIGGHWDDGRYLDAALAWANAAPLGTDHWSLRWPVVWPAALVIKWLGATRASLMVPGLVAMAALITVHFLATRRAFGSRVAMLALLALVTTPELLRAATRLTAELPELLAWVVALWAFYFAARGVRAQRSLLLLAGLATGLAWATRETAAGLIIVFGIAAASGWARDRLPLRRYLWLGTGFMLVALPEMLALACASGDALYRMHVDLRHIDIASSHLRGGIAHGILAPFNPALMARWDGAGPLRLHWAVDPWLNLFMNTAYGLAFAATGIVALVMRPLPLSPLRRAVLLPLLLVIVVQVATVLYIIATDPKPRMFLPATLAATLLFGLLAVRDGKSKARRVTVNMLLVAKLLLCAVTLDLAPSYARVDDQAAALLHATSGTVEADPWTRSTLALSPFASRLVNGPAAQVIVVSMPADTIVRGAGWQLSGHDDSGRQPWLLRMALAAGAAPNGALAHKLGGRAPIVRVFHAAAP